MPTELHSRAASRGDRSALRGEAREMRCERCLDWLPSVSLQMSERQKSKPGYSVV